ncbi:hypothetical protein HD806DRAFT_190849 [Xylariaceae sp. AK1471]|nr:hypothetical protein HD806DRAFT_190849 [Xylariaceae sp. AK1471]
MVHTRASPIWGIAYHMIDTIQPDLSAILVPYKTVQHVADLLWQWHMQPANPLVKRALRTLYAFTVLWRVRAAIATAYSHG